MSTEPLPVAAQVTEILPGVFRWAAFSPHHKVELAAHAVAAGGKLMIFDPIPLREEALASLRARFPQAVVLTTNENHERDTARWREVFSGAAGALALPTGWERWALPGGAPGETAFFLPTRSLMVFGDAVVNLPERGLELLPAKYCRDQAELRRSLGRLPEFQHAVFAHGEPLLGDAARRIRALVPA